MTPKEKAQELYWRYYQLVADGSAPEEHAKQCALIAIDEVISVALSHIYHEYNDATILSYYNAVRIEVKNMS